MPSAGHCQGCVSCSLTRLLSGCQGNNGESQELGVSIVLYPEPGLQGVPASRESSWGTATNCFLSLSRAGSSWPGGGLAALCGQASRVRAQQVAEATCPARTQVRKRVQGRARSRGGYSSQETGQAEMARFGSGMLPAMAPLLSLHGVPRFPRAVGGRWANRGKKKVSPWQAGIGFPRVPGERFLSLLDRAGGSRMPAFSFSGWAGQGCPGVG